MTLLRRALLLSVLTAALLAAFPLAALAQDPPDVPDAPPDGRLDHHRLSFEFQTWCNCGPANLTMALSYFGWEPDQHTAEAWLKPSVEDRNVSPAELVQYVLDQDELPGLRALWRYGGTIGLIKAFIAADLPVVVETGFQPDGEEWMGHYRTVIGYNEAAQTVWVYDTYEGQGPTYDGIALSYGEFDRWWRHFNRVFLVIYPQGREDDVAAILGSYTDPAYAAEQALSAAQAEAARRNDRWAWFNAGTSAAKLGRYDEAAVYYEEAFRQDLPFRMLWYQFGPFEALYHTGRYDEVIALADTVAATTQYLEETHIWRGLALAAQGRHAEAQAELDAALAFNPNSLTAHAALAQVEADLVAAGNATAP